VRPAVLVLGTQEVAAGGGRLKALDRAERVSGQHVAVRVQQRDIDGAVVRGEVVGPPADEVDPVGVDVAAVEEREVPRLADLDLRRRPDVGGGVGERAQAVVALSPTTSRK
jgi:hypothetical protein